MTTWRTPGRRRFDALLSATRSTLVDRVQRRLGQRLSASIEADDIVQLASVTAFGRYYRDRPRTRRDFVRWMLCIAEFEIKNTSRKLAPRTRPRRNTALPISMCSALPDDPLLGKSPGTEKRERFEQSLGDVRGLDEMQRVVVVLRDLLGLNLETTAFVTGRSPDATRSLHARARAALRG